MFYVVHIEFRKHAASHEKRRKKRQQRRADKRKWETEYKFEPYQSPWQTSKKVTRKSGTKPVLLHHTQYGDIKLLFVGYGVAIVPEGNQGMGLKAEIDIDEDVPITQYEGELITKSEADVIREMEEGKCMASHFATTSCRSMVINGFSWLDDRNPKSACSGVPLSLSEWKGRGGGSLCNHDDHPNAKLMRDESGDGYGIFVVSMQKIKAGDFIHVNYGKGFLNSKKSNL